MEPQQGSALMLATILVICFILLSWLPDPPSARSTAASAKAAQAGLQSLALNADENSFLNNADKKRRLLDTLRTSCLPKLVCQLLATTDRQLSRAEQSLLTLIKDTSLGTTAEVTSRLHFAAHMGQLVAGVDGAGCHNFYPSCPLPGNAVLPLLTNVRAKGFGLTR